MQQLLMLRYLTVRHTSKTGFALVGYIILPFCKECNAIHNFHTMSKNYHYQEYLANYKFELANQSENLTSHESEFSHVSSFINLK